MTPKLDSSSFGGDIGGRGCVSEIRLLRCNHRSRVFTIGLDVGQDVMQHMPHSDIVGTVGDFSDLSMSVVISALQKSHLGIPFAQLGFVLTL